MVNYNKKQVMTSIDGNVHLEAKRRRINVSEVLEQALHRKLKGEDEFEPEEKEYPHDMAILDAENFWITPEGKCKRRGKPQFLIQENGTATEVSRSEYLKWYNYQVKPQHTKKESPDEPLIALNGS